MASGCIMCYLTHWGRVTHICVSKLTTIGSDNGFLPDWRQAIIWTNAGILLIWNLGTNFSDFLCKILAFSFKKMHLKFSSGKWRPSCLGLNVLMSYIMCYKVYGIYSRHTQDTHMEFFITRRQFWSRKLCMKYEWQSSASWKWQNLAAKTFSKNVKYYR